MTNPSPPDHAAAKRAAVSALNGGTTNFAMFWTLARAYLDARERMEKAERALATLDRVSLVIESAVRIADPADHETVVAAIKAGRAALNQDPRP